MNSEELRRERKRLGLSQQELADLLDVQQRTISEWERGKVTIRHETILARALRDVARELAEDLAVLQERERAS